MEGKIYLERKNIPVNKQGCIKVKPEALAVVTNLSAKSGLSICAVASAIILQAVEKNLIEIKEG